jgi:hypothetical protein
MTPTIFERIRAVAPDLFINDLGEQSLIDIETDNGWGLIISNAVHEIWHHIKTRNDNVPGTYDVSEIYFSQIKEKHGALRMYFTLSDDYCEGVIDMASRMSTTTCEITGGIGHLCEKGGHYKTLSAAQAEQLGYRRVK